MDWMVVHFTLSFFLFQAVNSKISHPFDILQGIVTGPIEYINITALDAYRKETSNWEELDFKEEKFNFVIKMYHHLETIVTSNLNTIKRITKIGGPVEELRYSIMKSLKKENQLLKQFDLEKNIDIEHFFRLSKSEWLIEKYTSSLIQLQTLKFMISRWTAENYSHLKSNDEDDVVRFLNKFIIDEDLPEISPGDANYENLPSKFDDKIATDELERLQRMALIIKDQLYEMPKLENEDQGDDVKSKKIHSETPRWLLTERDIEEIRIKYIKWAMMFEIDPNMARLKDEAEKNGFRLNFFCKTLAEYYNLTSKLLECNMKDDTECQEMLKEIFQEERFKKFFVIFSEWKDSFSGSH